jgi:uncharacterized protein involved in response to NO
MKIKTWQIITVIICLILGVILHFTYEWSGENRIVGLFSAVNESTWEHLKLAFFPMLVMAIIGFLVIGKRTNNYWLAQTIGIIAAITFIVTFFYTYRGVLGKNIDALNIGSFFVAVILGEFVTYKILKSRKTYNAEIASIIFLVILFFSFILYTFYPPQIPLFKDPITGNYGIQDLT